MRSSASDGRRSKRYLSDSGISSQATITIASVRTPPNQNMPRQPYSGKIAPRNAFNSDWWSWFDIRIEQEFPAFAEGHKLAGWIMVKNFCNMLNDEWCVLEQASFPLNQPVVDVSSRKIKSV